MTRKLDIKAIAAARLDNLVYPIFKTMKTDKIYFDEPIEYIDYMVITNNTYVSFMNDRGVRIFFSAAKGRIVMEAIGKVQRKEIHTISI